MPEDLEAQLLAELRLEAVLLRVLEGDLALLVGDVVHHGHELEEVDLAGLLVERGLQLPVGAEDALGGLEDRLLDGLHQALAVDTLFFGDHVDRLEQVHVTLGCLLLSGHGLPLRKGALSRSHDFLFFFLPP